MQSQPVDRDRGAATVNETSASPGVGPTEHQPAGPGAGGAPAGSWAAGGATAGEAAAGARPGPVTAAAVILAVLGALGAVGNLLLLLAGNQLGQLGRIAPGGFDPALLGGLTIGAIVGLIIGVVQLVGGIGSWGGRNWGRMLGLAGSALGVIAGVLSVVGALGAAPAGVDPAARTTMLVTSTIILIGFAYSLYALVRHSDWFRARSGSKA
jgi:hypothetical protein